MPTLGDRMNSARSERPQRALVPRHRAPPGIALTGAGLTSITADPEREYLYAASKLTAYIYIIDIRDDSTGDTETSTTSTSRLFSLPRTRRLKPASGRSWPIRERIACWHCRMTRKR